MRCTTSAKRTQVDDLSSLVTMLVQTDKFGTSVAQSLRVHSDTSRTKRRQRAEEAAAKTGAKMVFPLVFCIFPAIWVVTIGPAAIKFVQVLVPLARDRNDDGHQSRSRTLPSDELAAPPLPRTVAETGLSVDQIEQLLVKTLYAGELTGVTLADRVCLPYSMLEPLIERLRAERLVEVRGATGSGTAGYRYALTDLGRDRARQYLEINRYIGPAPVSLASYVATMDALRQARGYIDRERLQQGFLASRRQRRAARSARAGRQRREGGVPLRPARQRQDGHRRRPRARARRRHVRAARDRRRRADRHDVRSDQPRDLRRGGRHLAADRRGATRSPLGPHPPAGGHGRRRADARRCSI